MRVGSSRIFSITAFPFLQEASASLGTMLHDDSQMREMREALEGLQIEVWYASVRNVYNVCAFTCILVFFRIESLSFENKHLISLLCLQYNMLFQLRLLWKLAVTPVMGWKCGLPSLCRLSLS